MSAKFKITNFQSIKEANIEADGLTIIVGESSQGKSACLRAINAACNNKFKQNFLRYGADMLTIGVMYDDKPDVLVVRKIKKESPEYELGELVFQKLNRTVPQEVVDFNNFGVIDYFEQKYPLNYFSQFSKPLLLEFSQKRILEILSSSKAYDDMNIASTNLNKHKEQNNGAFKQVSSMLSDNKNQLSKLKEQEALLHNQVAEMRRLRSQDDVLENKICNSENLIDNVKIYDKKALEASKLAVVLDFCDKIENKNATINNLQALITVYDEYDKKKERAEVVENRITLCLKVKEINETISSTNYGKYCELINLLSSENNTKLDKYNSMFNLTDKALNVKRRIAELDKKIEKISVLTNFMSMAKDAQAELKKEEYMIVNRICPVCGNKL